MELLKNQIKDMPNFPLGSVHAPVIFRCVCTLLSPGRDYTRYAVPVAALQLLHKHAAQFSLLLLDDHQVF